MSELMRKIINPLFALYIISGMGLLCWVVAYSGSGDGDTLEHVHSSWLVYHGKMPYKDFFQHHNPLLWYLGAPLVGMFEYSLRAVDAVNILTVATAAIMLWYIYLIHKNFLSNAFGGLVAAAFCILQHDSLYIKDFKPDNFMVASLVAGIYYLFVYLKEKKLSGLVLSFLLFFIAFMFTQKAALILLCVGVVILFLLYSKQMSWHDFLLGAALPVLVFAAYLAFLWYEDIFELYFKANFELNSHIPDVFYTRRFIYPSFEIIVPLAFAFYAMVKYVYNGSVYLKISAAVFASEYLIRMYYFTPFVYYFAFLGVMAALMAGYAAAELAKKHKMVPWLFLAYFIALGSWYVNIYRHRITVGDRYKYGASGLVLELANPCDYVVNGYRIGYNLFNKDIDYIWNLKGQIDVIAAVIGIRPTADLESLIRQYRPKIIYGKNYYDTYREYRGAIEVYPIHWISAHLLNEMYMPLNRDNLYILKPEYQKHDCHYNPRTKTYEYRDMD